MVGRSTGRGFTPLGTLFAYGAIGGQSDAELIELFAGGRAAEAAFEALVARHGPEVLKACRRVLADSNDVDDAFQATFLVLARRARTRSIARPDSLGPWLHGIALRVARKARVAAARRRRHEGRAVPRADEDPTRRDDLAGALRDEVDRLPEVLRMPVVLCYLEDLTYRAAAHRLAVSEGTIRGRLVKARGLLRSRLVRAEGLAMEERPAKRDRPARVPPALALATIRTAMTMTKSPSPVGAGPASLSAAVADLLEGVPLMRRLTRWMIAAAAASALAIGIAAAGGGGAPAALGDDKPAARAVATGESPGVQEAQPPPRLRKRLTLNAAIERLLDQQKRTHADRLEIPPAVADRLTRRSAPRPTPRGTCSPSRLPRWTLTSACRSMSA